MIKAISQIVQTIKNIEPKKKPANKKVLLTWEQFVKSEYEKQQKR